MKLGSKEYYDLLEQFEKDIEKSSLPSLRLDREKNKDLWRIGRIYENGEVNHLFIAYQLGYSFSKSLTN